MTVDQTLLNENQSNIAPAHVTQAHFDVWGIASREIARRADQFTSTIGGQSFRYKTDSLYLNSLLVARDVGVVEGCPFCTGIIPGEVL